MRWQKWTSDEAKEIASRLNWPHSLLPDIPNELIKAFEGGEPAFGRIIQAINSHELIKEFDPNTKMPRLRLLKEDERPKYHIGQWVWIITNNNVVKKCKITGIRVHVSRTIHPPAYCEAPSTTVEYTLVNDHGYSVKDPSYYHYQWSLYGDEHSALLQAKYYLNEKIQIKTKELEDLQKRCASNDRRIKKLEIGNASKERQSHGESTDASAD